MNETRSSGAGFIILLFLLGVGLLGAFLGVKALAAGQTHVTSHTHTGVQVAQYQSADWLAGSQVSVPSGIPITAHAAGHQGQTLDAWKLYEMLLAGECAASGVWCGATKTEQLYLCLDPATGLIGGLFRDENGIWNGFAARPEYWENKVNSSEWSICR